MENKKSFIEMFGYEIMQEIKADCKIHEDNPELKVWKKLVWKIGTLSDKLDFGDVHILQQQPK